MISRSILLPAESVIAEICERQQLPWNSGSIAEYRDFPAIHALFQIINSGIPREDFFYQGDLYRLHSPYVGYASGIDPKREKIVSRICEDDSCLILRNTTYSEKLVAFSKTYDFTRKVFYNVNPTKPATLIHVNTHQLYGIDVNVFMRRFGVLQKLYEQEHEVLFPLLPEFVIKEYCGTPNKFKYYLRGRPQFDDV